MLYILHHKRTEYMVEHWSVETNTFRGGIGFREGVRLNLVSLGWEWTGAVRWSTASKNAATWLATQLELKIKECKEEYNE